MPRLDLPGLGVSSACSVLLVYTIIEAPQHGWTTQPHWAGSRSAPLLLVVFVLVERRSAPDDRRHAVPDRRFCAASGAVTVAFFALFGFIFLMTQYFQFIRGYSALSTGARILPVAMRIAVASVVGVMLAADRHQGRRQPGLVTFGTSFAWISTVTVDMPYATIVARWC